MAVVVRVIECTLGVNEEGDIVLFEKLNVNFVP